MKYEADKNNFETEQYEMIRSFGESIYTGKENVDKAEMDQNNLLENMVNFNNKSRPKSKKEVRLKKYF